MLSYIANLVNALFWSWKSRHSGGRKMRLKAQHYRAITLPPKGGLKKTNAFPKNSKPIDISVCITCFNYSAYIKQAIDSVLQSDFGALSIEIIVVDDASTDDSWAVLKGLLTQASAPITIIRNLWNAGVSKSRNVALAHAQGAFLMTLDADNHLQPQALSHLHAAMVDSDGAAAYGPVARMNPDGTLDCIVSNRPFDIDYLLTQGNYVDAMAMFRRHTLLALGGYDTALLALIGGWEDYALWLTLGTRGESILFTPENIGVYRVKPNSMLNQITTDEKIEFQNWASAQFPGFTARWSE